MIAKFDHVVFNGLLHRIVMAHRFLNKGADPAEIHIPLVKEVDGIPVKYVQMTEVGETKVETVLNVKAAKEVLNATRRR